MTKVYGTHPDTANAWKNAFLAKGAEVFSQDSMIAEYERRIAELEQLFGVFLRRKWGKNAENHPQEVASWGKTPELSGYRDSNPRHSAWEADVLPLNYTRWSTAHIIAPSKIDVKHFAPRRVAATPSGRGRICGRGPIRVSSHQETDPMQETIPAQIQVFTDGGCKPNPGPGGWGAVIRHGSHEWFLSGNDPDTTNNQMELQAAIAALTLLNGTFGRCAVVLYTDSEYLRQGITEWLDNWERNGWKTRGDEEVKNQALWRLLGQLSQQMEITWQWVKGHADHPHNERADQLATRAREVLPAAQVRPHEPRRPAEVEIYVKASYHSGRQAGGWGVVLRKGETTRELSQQESNTSANALLIRAATVGLSALTRPCSVAIISDADYLIRGGSQWLENWLARDWVKRDGKPVANRADWEALRAALEPHHVTWQLGKVDEHPLLGLAAELCSASHAPDPAEAR